MKEKFSQIFLIGIAFAQSYLVATEENTLYEPAPEFQKQSQLRNLNDALSHLKSDELTLENHTDKLVTIGIYDFYHIEFDESDFISNTPTLIFFDSHYQIISSSSHVESEQMTPPRILVRPYHDKSENTAIILKSSVTVLPGACASIRAIAHAYIGRVICETPEKQITHSVLPDNKVWLVVEDSHDSSGEQNIVAKFNPLLQGEPNSFEQLITKAASLSFYEYLSSTIFAKYKITRKKFYQKLREVHQAGSRSIDDVDSAPKIPLTTHTFLAQKVDENTLINENQKKWFKRSIDTLPTASGWKHILWITEDLTPTLIENLGELAANIEIRSISSPSFSGIPCLPKIKELIELGLNKHASILFQYAVLTKEGGVIRGIDTEIIRDITPMNRMFNFYAGLESKAERMIDSNLFASTAGHSVVRNTLNLVKSHISELVKSLPLKEAVLLRDYHSDYANGPLSINFYQWAALGRDMIF